MKKNLLPLLTFSMLLTLGILFGTLPALAQNPLKEYKAGHVFYLSLPDYMGKTTGLNSAAIIQYKNQVKDIYGFVIEDNKEELALADLHYSSLNEFYDSFIKGFLKDEEKRTVSPAKYSAKGNIKFAEADASHYDKETEMEIYWLVGIVETKDAFYKVLVITGSKRSI